VIHHGTQLVLDRLAGEKSSRGWWPGLTSWWAGMFACLTASLVTTMLLVGGGIVDAGHVVQSVQLIFVRSSITDLLSWPSLVWVAAAAALYAFERQAKHVFATKSANTPTTAVTWKFYAASIARAVVLTAFLSQLILAMLVVGAVAMGARFAGTHTIAALFGALFVVSPIIIVAVGDHGVRHLLRLFGLRHEGLALWPSVYSWWTGLFSWFVLAFGGISAFAVHAVVFGNRSGVDPRAFHSTSSITITFMIVAAVLFHVEACLRRRLATKGE
jgi:hypothetical protein